ncbi:MAG: 6-hydroxymethylpterin diphosphokinase MptE-like protein [Spirochaetales bacterium]
MKIRLDVAKNGSKTCVADGRFLYSKYNPEHEVQKFVESVNCDYRPSCLIVTGDCLGYVAMFLKKRFSDIPLYAIRYDRFFVDTTVPAYEEDFPIFLCTQQTEKEQLCEEIFSEVGESALSAALCISWKSGDELFATESSIAWQAIKLLLQKTRDVIATRSYFSLRWLKNTVLFFLHIAQPYIIKPTKKPVLLIASGPSLLSSLSQIKKYRRHFFVLALSSALMTLAEHSIYPDVCIATDGGFYAKKHLFILQKLQKKGIFIPLAVSAEAAVPTKILNSAHIIPLRYGDAIENDFFNLCKIPALHAQRNGTVSGTAAELALTLTGASVFACGLDLCEGKGYSHSQPNAQEIENALKDFRLAPLSTRLYLHNPNGKTLNALDLYHQWFCTRDKNFAKRFYRLSNEGYNNSLGIIKDITWNDIDCKNFSSEEAVFIKYDTSVIANKAERQKALLSIIHKAQKNPSKLWYEHCALAEYLATKKYPNVEKYQKKLHNKLQKAFATLENICR